MKDWNRTYLPKTEHGIHNVWELWGEQSINANKRKNQERQWWPHFPITIKIYFVIFRLRYLRKAILLSSFESSTGGTHISVNRLRRAGDNSFLPKSPPGFIVPSKKKLGWATIFSSSEPPFSANDYKKQINDSTIRQRCTGDNRPLYRKRYKYIYMDYICPHLFT